MPRLKTAADILLAALFLGIPQGVFSQPKCVPATTAPCETGTSVLGHEPGIWVASSNLPLNLPPQPDPRREIILQCTWNDARVLGGNIIVPWAKFDLGPSNNAAATKRYDFTWVEEQMSLWADKGKKVNLLVWSSAQQTRQQFDGESMTPQWLLDLGVPTVTCDADGPDGPKEPSPIIPVHNNDVVRGHFQDALTAIYNEYKDDARVNYVRFGAGVGSESYPINSAINPRAPCRDAWFEKGGDVEAWKNHVVTMIEFFGQLQNEGYIVATTPDAPDDRTAEARDNAPIVVSLNDYKDQEDFDKRLHKVADAAFDAARVHRLGIGCQGPTDRHRRWYEEGQVDRCTANWCQIFDQAKADPRVPVVEIQTPNASGPRGCSRCGDGEGPGYTPTGPLQLLAPFLLDRGVTSFELYPSEFRIANMEGGNSLHDEFGEIYDATFDLIASESVQNAKQKWTLIEEMEEDAESMKQSFTSSPAMEEMFPDGVQSAPPVSSVYGSSSASAQRMNESSGVQATWFVLSLPCFLVFLL